MLVFIACCSNPHDDVSSHADMLCMQLWDSRYDDVGHYDSIANCLHDVADGNDELVSISDNALGYSSMMKMDYSKALELYSGVVENSDCEIERLTADVGLMTVCYRVSENRRFFDYRASALSRIRRIGEELDFLSQSDSMRYMRAKLEFGIVSVCYFSNLHMNVEKARALEHIRNDIKMVDDDALQLYAEMILANNVKDPIERLKILCDGATESHKKGNTWLEANYKLLLAISLRDSMALRNFKEQLPEYHSGLGASNADYDFLTALATDAVDCFGKYGDRYMMMEALAVLASCNIEYGRYEDALSHISEALEEVNEYYWHYYPSQEELCKNTLDRYDEGLYDGNTMDDGIYDIPECLLSIRREASCAFAALGDIEASYINRNAYLDLLRTTRQNKHIESRLSIAEEKIAELDYLMAFVVLLLVAVCILVAVMHRKYSRHVSLYSVNLKRLQRTCMRLFSSLPREVESKDELCRSVSGILNECMRGFSGETRFSVVHPFDDGNSLSNIYEFKLKYMSGEANDTLYLATEYPLIPEQHSVVAMMVPYVAAAVEEGLRLADISDERIRAEEAHQAHSIYLTEHKRENLLKRVSVSIVGGMRPYMDRISKELSSLQAASSAEDVQRKLQYVAELTRKLDDFNVILEKWIKMRQGEMNLQIENFSLSGVFAIVMKSKALLEKRGIELEVKDTLEVVKADKALTLFMVNTLVDNAAKFTPEGGKVVLESACLDDCVEISVTDTGVGISQADIERILGEKVYDASSIGKDNEHLPVKKKGGGFGLMNCKGVVEKYRKYGEIFSVCRMDIKSTKGKGSRFSFRLPKGVLRTLLVLIAFMPLSLSAQGQLLDSVYMYVDSVYTCNANGNYEKAFINAGHALELLNVYYRANVGGTDTLSLYSGTANEIKWWREGLFPDSLKDAVYYNVLDIRNEMAVASLATQKWHPYRYNNNVYTTLYSLVHEDKGIADRYTTVRSGQNYRIAAVALLLFLLLMVLLFAIVSYVRHNVIRRKNENMLLKVDRSILQLTAGNGRVEAEELLEGVVDAIYDSMGENMRMSRVAAMLRTDGYPKPVVAEAGDERLHDGTERIFMLGVLDSGDRYVSPDRSVCVLPMHVNSAGDRILIGAIEVVSKRPLVDDEMLNLELVANYTASVAYHALVRVASGYLALDEIEEETERVKHEETRLHVQNMVLDNCLSVLKHETIYYPSRIRDIAEQVVAGNDGKGDAVASMKELMDYYSSIFGILGNCAKRELDDRCFTVSKVEVMYLFDSAARYAGRLRKKSGRNIHLSLDSTALTVNIDRELVEFLLESLIGAAFKIDKEGELRLHAEDMENVVRIELYDNRYELTSDEVADLFVPTRRNIQADGTISGMEYLVAKEIIRLHEDNTGHRGSRLEARSDASGTVILFTLPKRIV